MILEFTMSHVSGSRELQGLRCCGSFTDLAQFYRFCDREGRRGWLVRAALNVFKVKP